MQLVTTILVATNVIIFLFMYKENHGALWSPSTELLLQAGADYGPLTAQGQWWRVVTSGFVHVGAIHLALNMCALSSIGSAAERSFGVLKYLLIYFIAMIAGSVLSLFFHPYEVGAGASGAIFGLLGSQLVALAAMCRKTPKAQLLSILVSAVITIGFFFAVGIVFPQIDNYAHLGGLAAGIATGIALLPLNAKSKLPNILNFGAIAAVVIGLSQANVFVEHHVREAAADMTANQRAEIHKVLKEGKLPFWLPARIGSPVEALAPAALQCGDYKTALLLADKEVALDPDNGYPYYTRALVHHKFNHDKEALHDADKAVSLAPQEYAFRLLKAKIELRLRRLDEALSDVHAALGTERKEHAEAEDIAGSCHLAGGNRTEALKCFNRAIAEDSQLGDPYYHRATVEKLAGESIKAEQDFIRAQDRNYLPDDWDKSQLTK